jgi:formiminoglutamase
VLGVPAHRTSISPTGASETPAAIRTALARFSTWVGSAELDIATVRVLDLGDVVEPDGPEGERATTNEVRQWPDVPLLALGGDNSITYAVAHGAYADGLVTLDAHHDLREGASNGSPVRRLVEAGLAGSRVVQVGIADFANSAEYAARARALGITVVHRDALGHRPMSDVMAEALDIAGGGEAGRVHVDLDVDVCDRAVAPGCPASLPGGISAAQLRAAARAAGVDPRVVSIDITEVDATADAPDQRTVRLAALCLLEVAAGVARRPPPS